jgi:hypothetical protein
MAPAAFGDEEKGAAMELLAPLKKTKSSFFEFL